MCRRLLNLLTSRGGIFVPEEWEDWSGKEFLRRKFSRDSIESILDQWQGLRSRSKGLSLYSRKPFDLWFLAHLLDFARFDTFHLYVEKAYGENPSGLKDVMEVSRILYDLLIPAYGEISFPEMHRGVPMGKEEALPGIDLERQGLPDIYWANFLGPEYVEMFGLERVLSAPCDTVERLAGGGALLILTESPLDFGKNPVEFNRKRDQVRSHLGEDAFFLDYQRPASRIPRFRFWDERQNLIQQSLAKMPKAKPASQKSIRKAGDQLERLTQLADALSVSLKDSVYSGLSLENSSASLDALDDVFSRKAGPPKSEELESQVGAYLGILTQKRFRGEWRLDKVLGTPALDIPKPGEKLPSEFEPFEGRELPFGLEDVPDVLVEDKLVRVWPFAKAQRLLRSEMRGRDFRSYMDAIQKGLGMKGKTFIRIP